MMGGHSPSMRSEGDLGMSRVLALGTLPGVVLQVLHTHSPNVLWVVT